MNPPIDTTQIRNAGQVNVGDKVMACWTSNFEVHREPAIVTRVNRSSIRVQLEGRERNFPLPLAGGNGFSANNCAYMIERDESMAPGQSAMERAEHLQAKADRREDWADKARARADAKSRQFDGLLQAMNGTPVLVGHHSEKRHRRDLDRVDRALRTSVEETRKAEHHERRAAGLAREAARLEQVASSADAIEDDRAWIASLARELGKRKKSEGWKTVRKAGTFRGGLRVQVYVADARERSGDLWLQRDRVYMRAHYQGFKAFDLSISPAATPEQVAQFIAQQIREA